MKCPRCGFDLVDGEAECIKCGVVIEKYLKHRRTSADTRGGGCRTIPEADERGKVKDRGRMRELFFSVGPEAGNVALTGRAILLAVLLVWGLKLVLHSVESNYAGESFLHLINLPFHEAGHVIFRGLGQFMATLGGSLMQLLVPLICLLTFLLRTRDPFGASVSLWWLGENLLDLAPYINDARALDLILLGGVTGKDVDDFHDWEYILRKTGLLQYDLALAKTAHVVGAMLMACAVIWGGLLVYAQIRSQREEER